MLPATWVRLGQDSWDTSLGHIGTLVPEGFERILCVDSILEDEDGEPCLDEQAHAVAIAEVAARHTTTPDHAYFAIWEGHGYDERGLDHVLRFADREGARDYFLLEGPLSAVGDLVWPNQEPTTWLRPDLWWPADRAWIVCTDVDLACNYVAGTRALIDEIASVVATETHLVTRTDPFERVD